MQAIQRERLVIKDTTLVCVDCVNLNGAINAIEKSLEQCSFNKVILLTSLDTDYRYAVKIPSIASIKDYSIFIVKELHKYVNTKYMLIIQHDGWIVDVSKWKDEFYNYDYIGGICNWMDDEGKGGNGGFSWRSLELMKKASEIMPLEHCHPEDVSMSGKFKNETNNGINVTGYRKELEANGFKFASVDIQKLWGYDWGVYNGTFGHHKGDIENACKIVNIRKNRYVIDNIDNIVEITKAIYGSEFNDIDVTGHIKSNGNIIVASNTLFGTDPHIGVRKKLKLWYKKNGKEANESFNEGDTVILSELKEPITPPKIYDCFPFFNELEVLDIRLNEMYDIVEKFVIIEGDKTHTGNPKESYYLKNIDRYKKFSDKIVHRIVELPINGQWSGERFQRECICDVLKEMNVDSDSIIIISDADEIPNAKGVIDNISYIVKNDFVSMIQKRYDYKLNLLDTAHGVGGSRGKIFTYKNLDKERLFDVRFGTDGQNPIQCGWHFSWLGNSEQLNEKMNAIAESGAVKGILATTSWDKLIGEGKYFLTGEKLKVVPIDDSFPKYVRDNLEKFDGLMVKFNSPIPFKFYLINLINRKDKLDNATFQFTKIGKKFDLFQTEKPSSAGGFSYAGQRGCYESHRNIWDMIRISGLEDGISIICEDDLCIMDGFKEMFEKYLDLFIHSDYNMMYFYDSNAKDENEIYLRNTTSFATHFYAIKNKDASILLKTIIGVKPIDELITNANENNTLKVCSTSKTIVKQNRVFGSDIVNGTHPSHIFINEYSDIDNRFIDLNIVGEWFYAKDTNTEYYNFKEDGSVVGNHVGRWFIRDSLLKIYFPNTPWYDEIGLKFDSGNKLKDILHGKSWDCPFVNIKRVIPTQYFSKKIFIDGGCYTGDSISNFLTNKIGSNQTAIRPDANEYEIYGFDGIRYDEWANITTNKISLNTKLLGTKDEFVLYYNKKYNKGNSIFINNEMRSEYDVDEIEMIDLSRFIKTNFTLNDYIVLKLDIEGAEYDILEKMLDDGTINYINELYVEFHAFSKRSSNHDITIIERITKCNPNLFFVRWY